MSIVVLAWKSQTILGSKQEQLGSRGPRKHHGCVLRPFGPGATVTRGPTTRVALASGRSSLGPARFGCNHQVPNYSIPSHTVYQRGVSSVQCRPQNGSTPRGRTQAFRGGQRLKTSSSCMSLGLEIAQRRSHVHTAGLKGGIMFMYLEP